jgi:hypothetical protein
LSEEQECARDGEATKTFAAAAASWRLNRNESSPRTPSSTCKEETAVDVDAI